jgi:membrane-associated protease RseP (regulator of RpoE activity)
VIVVLIETKSGGLDRMASLQTFSNLHRMWLATLRIVYRRMKFSPLVVASILSAIACSDAQGQSFLEKLESVTKQKLGAGNQSEPSDTGVKQEELPPPAESGRRQPPLSGSVPNSPPAKDGNVNSQPSILEKAPTVPAPLQLSPAGIGDEVYGLGGERSVEPGQPSQGLYLGIEVEEPVGGGIGVRVAAMTDNSPAWKAGFKIGDRILAIDGFAIANIDSMADRLKLVTPRKPTKFLINRAGRNMDLTAVLMDASLAGRIHGMPNANNGAPFLGAPWIGIEVNNLTQSFRDRYGLSIYTGAGVESVVNGSPAFSAGMRPGDAIIEIDNVPIATANDVARWIAAAKPDQPAEFLVFRGGKRIKLSMVVASDPRQLSPSPVSDIGGLFPNDLAGQSNSRLQAEVIDLRSRLEVTQRQLEQTQQRLNEVLQRLEQR